MIRIMWKWDYDYLKELEHSFEKKLEERCSQNESYYRNQLYEEKQKLEEELQAIIDSQRDIITALKRDIDVLQGSIKHGTERKTK